MTRIGVITSRATSLMNVARDIAFVIQNKGLIPMLFDYLLASSSARMLFDKAIIVMTMNPLVSRSWFMLSRDLLKDGVPSLVYTTIEGSVPKRYVKDWMRNEVLFVANSNYTYSKLVEAGLRVIDIVYHGVNFNDINMAKQYTNSFKNYLRDKLGDGIVFGTIASNHPRKGLEYYRSVVRNVCSKTDKAKFYILTTPGAIGHFTGINTDRKCVVVDTRFGQLERNEVLGLLSAFDYYVQPTLAEGFGLPVLEAMALGVPCIHIDYPPLTEFSDKSFNIMVPFKQITYNSFGEGINYELHIYDPNDMTEAILEAIDIYENNKSKYEDMKAKAIEKAKQYDIMKLYPRLLEILDKTVDMVNFR